MDHEFVMITSDYLNNNYAGVLWFYNNNNNNFIYLAPLKTKRTKCSTESQIEIEIE